MKIAFTDLAGVRTRYYSAGSGPDLVLVHGTGASADTWVRNIEALAERHRVLAPDLPGHGFTDYVDFSARPPHEVCLEHLSRFIDRMTDGPVCLAGSSFGGHLAALHCLNHPEDVAQLVIVGTGSIFNRAEEQDHVFDAALANQLPALREPTRESIRKRNVGSNFRKDDPFEEIVLTQLTAFALPDRCLALQQMIEGLKRYFGDPRYRVVDQLERITVPTLVITGRQDPRAEPGMVQREARRMPDHRVEILDNCGHKPFVEHTARFNQLVGEFLERGRDAG